MGKVENERVTSRDAMHEDLEVLQAHKDMWASTGIDERMSILEEIRHEVKSVSQSWVALCMEAKGIRAHTRGEGEEWGILANIYNFIGALRQSLGDIQHYGRPQIAGPVTLLPDGQVSARVFPRTRMEAMLYAGFSQEVWMEPGVSIEQMLQSQARIYKGTTSRGTVNLVLGAGNASSLPVNDSLSKLFVEKCAVVLKLNPVNSYLGPLITKIFRPLIDRGFFRMVYGGTAEGEYLCNHPAVDAIHLTGSDATFESIVFGSGTEGVRRKAQKQPLVVKPVTGELGNITPVIMVPGPWSANDIRKQAQRIAAWLTYNAGCNCLTPRVIVQHGTWPQREAFLEAIGGILSTVETRKAYYPGAMERHAAFLSAHPEARRYGSAMQGHLPWTLVADVDPKDTSDICFTTEAFCSLIAETALQAGSPAEFMDRAVDFANGTLWGTLTASIIIHPQSLLDPDVAASLERAVRTLRYGTIGVNVSGSAAYNLGLAPWGGFPGHDMYDVQSGTGVTNNALMLSRTQKSVVRGPFIKTPDPDLATGRHYGELQKRFTRYLASPSILKIPGIVWTSLKG